MKEKKRMVVYTLLLCLMAGVDSAQTVFAETVAEAGNDAEAVPDEDTGALIEEARDVLGACVDGYEGDWSVYVEVLDTGDELLLNEMEMTSASLIKLFVMAKTFRDRDAVTEHLAARMGLDPGAPEVSARLDSLLRDMIAASGNEAFNELVRLQTEEYDFLSGARAVDRYLLSQGYESTSVQGSLYPSDTDPVTLGGSNHTTVRDCGLLLHRIYWGECVDQHTSQEMLNLLFAQETDFKIPAGLPEDTLTANKTGETDSNQHDAAIILGKNHNYILCVMSQNCPEQDAIHHIRELSEKTFSLLNPEME